MIAGALLVGQDTDWDLRNYHFYNGFSHIYGGFDQNFFPAMFQSWHNATIDMFNVALIENFSPKIATILLVFVQSLNVPLVFIISLQALQPVLGRLPARSRTILLTLAVLIGATGPMLLSEVGLMAGDNITSIAVLASLAALGHAFYLNADKQRPYIWIALSGAALGAGIGMKFPAGIFAPGLGLCVLMIDERPPEILKAIFLFGIGAIMGLAITDGAWAWKLWEMTGSPVFPVMNGLFRSPWVDPISMFDERFQPHSTLDALLFPFRTAFNEHPGSELSFRDLRFAFALLLIPAAIWKKPQGWPMALLLFFYLSAVIWLWRFGIERFAIPLELLSGPILILIVSRFIPARNQVMVVLTMAIILVATTRVPDWGHSDWEHAGKDGNWFDVQVPSELTKQNQMFLMLDDFPSAYAIPSFPKDARFVRIEGNLNPAPTTLLAIKRAEAIKQQSGSIFTYGPHEPDIKQQKLLATYGLHRSKAACLKLPTNVETLMVCPIKR